MAKTGKWHDKKVMSFVRGKAKNLVEIATEFVEGQAKLLCAVDTGELRKSINSKVRTKGNEVIGKVGTNVEYAPYIEFGSKGNKPQPFLRPAIDTNKNVIKKILGAK